MLVVVQIVNRKCRAGVRWLRNESIRENPREKLSKANLYSYPNTHIDNTYISVFWSKKGKPTKISSIVRFGRKLELMC